jgi:queuine tRNA-ribosyltransferase
VRSINFEVQAVCPVTGARAGVIHTAHGDIPTPVFMPVGTQATVKAVPQRDLIEELDARIILANTYHLFLRPGHELIESFGGLHGFMQWPRAILTDSGGFQVWSLSKLRKLKEEGVVFQSHLNGDRHLFTPESVVDVQLAFNSDILMKLDECTAWPAEEAAARKSMELTVRWARRGYAHYAERMKAREPGNALFPIVQGSMFANLRAECVRELTELDADGYAIGGLSVGEPRELSLEMASLTAPLLPPDRPRYVMGVGTPEELSEYVGRGVDMMDCVMPSRNARNGCLFTSTGKLLIKQARFRDDHAPVDANCGCYCCRTFSRAYLRHLFISSEILYSTLATIHNLRHYLDIMRRMRQAILLGTFPEFLQAARALPSDA